MQLKWSHAVLYARDEQKMLDFYTDVLGFRVTDRGLLNDGMPDVIFMSQDPAEHHQIGMVAIREGEEPPNTVNHFAFRVDHFADIQTLKDRLEPIEGVKINPLSHGNTLSIYFNDPEGNGLEVFWDTPWHVAQPMARPWDPAMNEQQALEWLESEFRDAPGFMPAEDYHRQLAAELAQD